MNIKMTLIVIVLFSVSTFAGNPADLTFFDRFREGVL